ncbi:MAG: RNA repair transcriptional activator RtcR [Phycisphaerales bacterium]
MTTKPAKSTVVFGLLGTVLDGGAGPRRWERWRPSVALCQQEDLLVSRFELLHDRRHLALARTVRDDIASISPETQLRLHEVNFKDPWDLEEVYGALADFVRGQTLDLDREEYLVHITTGTHVAQICLFLLTEARYIPGRLVQTAPGRSPGAASDAGGDAWHHTSTGHCQIIDLDLSRYDRLAARFRREKADSVEGLKSGITTRNAAFNRMIEQVEHVAAHSVDPILLVGPTGAGKSQLARRVFELKRARRRVAGAFVEVNCATIRGDTAMSTLFGHRRGAFTGAAADRPGLLRAADGGMLFLDEIGELGADEQAMLLRALEEKRFLPLGSDREVESDFQLIAGTNRDLARLVAEGSFREDLLARINLWTYRLPALCERPEDIEPNIDYEIDRFARRAGRQVRFSRQARDRYVRFATGDTAIWAANFRDLNASVTRMATLAAGGRITEEVVDDEIARLREAWAAIGGVGAVQRRSTAAAVEPQRGETTASATVDRSDQTILATVLSARKISALDPFDAVQLAEVVRACRASASMAEAGRILFAASRRRRNTVNDGDRLRKYLARFALAWDDVSSPPGAAVAQR